MEEKFVCNTPIGTLEITIKGNSVVGIRVAGDVVTPEPPCGDFARSVSEEINGYFAGRVREFSFPTAVECTPFQRKVWNVLRSIPYGCTMTYGEVASSIGSPAATRAVGNACNCNPLLLAVPCHRVVGAGGKLTGFAAGLERKRFLLELEKRVKFFLTPGREK
jgi:methylated-DNA-[protein]-cysteine S-methyltransferase